MSKIRLRLVEYCQHRETCEPCRRADDTGDGALCPVGQTLRDALQDAIVARGPQPQYWIGRCRGVPKPGTPPAGIV